MKLDRGQVLDEINGKIMHDDEALKVAAQPPVAFKASVNQLSYQQLVIMAV